MNASFSAAPRLVVLAAVVVLPVRARLTTAVSTLDTTVLESVPYANPASALRGTVPGLRVQTTSGQPGVRTPHVFLLRPGEAR